MKVMIVWTLLPGSAAESVEKFLAGDAATPEGVTLLGRWHRMDGAGGYTLYETNQPTQVFRAIVRWADLIEFEAHVVMEDGEIAPVLAEEFGK